LFLERVKANGYCYLYLNKYEVREHYANNKRCIYRFGRIEQALRNFYKWKNNPDNIPEDLKRKGVDERKLTIWIMTLEKGKHPKTGRKFEPIKII